MNNIIVESSLYTKNHFGALHQYIEKKKPKNVF